MLSAGGINIQSEYRAFGLKHPECSSFFVCSYALHPTNGGAVYRGTNMMNWGKVCKLCTCVDDIILFEGG